MLFGKVSFVYNKAGHSIVGTIGQCTSYLGKTSYLVNVKSLYSGELTSAWVDEKYLKPYEPQEQETEPAVQFNPAVYDWLKR